MISGTIPNHIIVILIVLLITSCISLGAMVFLGKIDEFGSHESLFNHFYQSGHSNRALQACHVALLTPLYFN